MESAKTGIAQALPSVKAMAITESIAANLPILRLKADRAESELIKITNEKARAALSKTEMYDFEIPLLAEIKIAVPAAHKTPRNSTAIARVTEKGIADDDTASAAEAPDAKAIEITNPDTIYISPEKAILAGRPLKGVCREVIIPNADITAIATISVMCEATVPAVM
jgi:hypothetical protein